MKFNRLITLGLLLATPAHATQVQLILDASGSMYGKLPAGQTRIQAAREVLSNFIASLPEDPELHVGLRVYGAKLSTTNTCEDSQLVLPMQGVNRAGLQDTIQKTVPKGATPIAFSLQQAAEDFPVNDEKKVIVLVTDGIESCGGDLKGAMEAFKQKGIQVELHVIGIDLDERAQNSFKGLGTFQNTTTAPALAQALGTAVKQVVKTATLTAPVEVQLTRNGEPAAVASTVTLQNPVTGANVALGKGSTPSLFSQTVPTGTYSVHINTPQGVRTYSGVVVNPGGENTYRFEVPDLKKPVEITLNPIRPVMDGKVDVYMQNVPDDGKDGYLTWVRPDLPDYVIGEELYVGNQNGVVNVRLPESPEALEFRYYRVLPNRTVQVLGRSPVFSPLDVPSTVKLPAQVTAGNLIQTEWTGPGNDGDYLAVVKEGTVDGVSQSEMNFSISPDQKVLSLRLEPVPGKYELRYMTRSGRVLARQAFTAVQAQYSVSGPKTVKVAEKFQVTFKGPGQPWDYVGIVPKGSTQPSPDQWSEAVSNLQEGTFTLTAPLIAGDYQLAYYSTRAGKTFASQDLKIEDVTYRLTAPESVPSGGLISVKWEGAGARSDHLTLVPKGSPEGTINHGMVMQVIEANPLQLKAPIQQGEYELRYISGDLNWKTQTSTVLKVTAPEITLTHPATVMAGSVLKVKYLGPNNSGDFVTLVPEGSPDGTYLDMTWTADGNPALVPTPELPGSYEVRYMNREGFIVLHSQKVTLSEPKANLQVPAVGKAGSAIRFLWSGPGGPKDQIVLARQGSEPTEWLESYALGQALQLDIRLPGEAGNYELRYLTQNGVVLASAAIKVQ